MGNKIETTIESFELDHNAVKAPYVRLIAVEHGPDGTGTVSNFDLRLTQPNATAVPTGGLHTIEHLLAGLLRDRLPGVIDCSPFGCRTGFHLITWSEPSVADVADAFKAALSAIAHDVEWADVPGTTAESCGNYRDHSLFSAQEWCKTVLDEGISLDPFDRAKLA